MVWKKLDSGEKMYMLSCTVWMEKSNRTLQDGYKLNRKEVWGRVGSIGG